MSKKDKLIACFIILAGSKEPGLNERKRTHVTNRQQEMDLRH